MEVTFFDENDAEVSKLTIDLDHYDDVCRKAWDKITDGEIKAVDFQVNTT